MLRRSVDHVETKSQVWSRWRCIEVGPKYPTNLGREEHGYGIPVLGFVGCVRIDFGRGYSAGDYGVTGFFQCTGSGFRNLTPTVPSLLSLTHVIRLDDVGAPSLYQSMYSVVEGKL